MPSSAQAWDLESITFGHFLSPASQDALISGTGCEPHANGMHGAYLFTRDKSEWRKVWYSAGQNAGDCKKLVAADKRDLLICEGSDMHQGVADSFLYLLDAGEDPRKRPDNSLNIFFGLNDSLPGCTELPDGTVVSGKMESVVFTPVGAAGAVRIGVTARLGKAPVPEKALSACNLSNFQRRPGIATVRRRYEFLFDGRKVVPDPRNPPVEHVWAIAPPTAYTPAR